MENSDVLKIVGAKIKKLRIKKSLTQVELVGKMDGEIDPTNISRIEVGRTNPTLITLYRIAKALEVELKDLIDI